jgi:hypothetical protein
MKHTIGRRAGAATQASREVWDLEMAMRRKPENKGKCLGQAKAANYASLTAL